MQVTRKISSKKIKLVLLRECLDKWFSVNERKGGGANGTHPLPIREMELPGVHWHRKIKNSV